MNQMNKQYTTRVDVTFHDGGKPKVGTAFPIGPNLFLTARHVLWPLVEEGESERRRPKGATLTVGPLEGMEPTGGSIYRTLTLEDHKCSEALDVALIRTVESLPDDDAMRYGLLLARRPVWGGARWETQGFPSLRDGHSPPEAGVPFDGRAHSHAPSAEVMDLTSGDYDERWNGLSGAPVFIGPQIFGVITVDPKVCDGQRLHAVPMVAILKDKDLARWLEEAGFGKPNNPEAIRVGALQVLGSESKLVAELGVELKLSSPTTDEVLDGMVGSSILTTVVNLLGVLDRAPELHSKVRDLAGWVTAGSREIAEITDAQMRGIEEGSALKLQLEEMVELIFCRERGRPAGYRLSRKKEGSVTGVRGAGQVAVGLEVGFTDTNAQLIRDTFAELKGCPEIWELLGVDAEVFYDETTNLIGYEGSVGKDLSQSKAVLTAKANLAIQEKMSGSKGGGLGKYILLVAKLGSTDAERGLLNEKANALRLVFGGLLSVVQMDEMELGDGYGDQITILAHIRKLYMQISAAESADYKL